MIHKKLLNSLQSGFRPNDSCINQLVSITHNIYHALNANPSLEAMGQVGLLFNCLSHFTVIDAEE